MAQIQLTYAEALLQNVDGTSKANSFTIPAVVEGSDEEITQRRNHPLTEIYKKDNFVHDVFELQNFEEFVKEEKLRNAKKDEITYIERNDTWLLVDVLEEKEALSLK